MKNYIYKVIVLIIAVILIFEFTIGKYLDNFNEKINYLTTKDGRKKMISSIKKEMQKANSKENYLDEEERILLRNFIIKITKELNLEN